MQPATLLSAAAPPAWPPERAGRTIPKRPAPSREPEPFRSPEETPVLTDNHPEETPPERPE